MFPYLHITRPSLGSTSDELRSLAAELERDVRMLSEDIGPRGTHKAPAYALAQAFLSSALQKAGHEVQRQTWTAHDVICTNLECTIGGTTHPELILVVGAHYDSVAGCPAANDNASGVAGILALARRASARPLAVTLRLVLFANEEPPYFNIDEMGSQLYARRARKQNEKIIGMFCLETIGCYLHEKQSQTWPMPALSLLLPTVGNFICFVGPSEATDLIKTCTKAFEKTGAFPLVAAAVPGSLADQVNWSDHRGFNEVGYPAFMITDTAPLRYIHYHEQTDTFEKLDYLSMARVVQGVHDMLPTVARELAAS
jgi:Zn-dependent M28 family amino/carboxypeptidase